MLERCATLESELEQATAAAEEAEVEKEAITEELESSRLAEQELKEELDDALHRIDEMSSRVALLLKEKSASAAAALQNRYKPALAPSHVSWKVEEERGNDKGGDDGDDNGVEDREAEVKRDGRGGLSSSSSSAKGKEGAAKDPEYVWENVVSGLVQLERIFDGPMLRPEQDPQQAVQIYFLERAGSLEEYEATLTALVNGLRYFSSMRLSGLGSPSEHARRKSRKARCTHVLRFLGVQPHDPLDVFQRYIFRRVRAELRRPNITVLYRGQGQEGGEGEEEGGGGGGGGGPQHYVPGGLVESMLRDTFAPCCESVDTLAFVAEASIECIANTPIGLGTELHALVAHGLVIAGRIVEAQRGRVESIFKASALRAQVLDRKSMSLAAFAECFRVVCTSCGGSTAMEDEDAGGRGRFMTVQAEAFRQFIEGLSSRATSLREGAEDEEETLEVYAGEALSQVALVMEKRDEAVGKWAFTHVPFVDVGLVGNLQY